MKKIMVPILVMVFVFSLTWMAGAQTSTSGQSGSGRSDTGPFSSGQPGSGTTGSTQGTDQSGTSQQYGGTTPESRQGTDRSGTSQQQKGKESQMRHEGKSMQNNRASHWIGKKVQNPQGENLGEIEDLVLNSKGQVDFVIVSHGGTLGIGEKYTAVPYKAFSRKGDTMTLNMSKEKMTEAPNFDRNSWPDMTNRKWSEDVYRYYGQKPSWRESSHPSQKPSKDSSRTEQNKKKME